MNEEVDKICQAVKAALASCNIPVTTRESALLPPSYGMEIVFGKITPPILVSFIGQGRPGDYFIASHDNGRETIQLHKTRATSMLASWIISYVFVEHTNPILARFYPGVFDR